MSDAGRLSPLTQACIVGQETVSYVSNIYKHDVTCRLIMEAAQWDAVERRGGK